MTINRQAGIALARLAAGVTAIAGALILISITAPLSPIADWASRFLPLSDVPAARAAATLSGPVRRLDQAAVETSRELAMAPRRPDGWLRLAFIHAEANAGKLDAPALGALKRSYDIDPFDNDLGLWRLTLVFNHWSEVDSPINRKAIEELSGLWAIGRLRRDLRDLPSHISPGDGRLAAGLQLKRLESLAIHH